jgi:N-acetylmuramoyl-L-alanine amidase
MSKIGIIVGHSRRADMGAESAGGESNEWAFWNGMISRLRDALPSNTYYVNAVEAGSYTEYTSKLASQLSSHKVTVAVELHFNAFNGTAKGFEALYWHTSTQGKRLAETLVATQQQIGRPGNRGAKPITAMGRGSQFLRKTQCPAVIWEPFFGDNPSEWAFWSSDTGKGMLVQTLRDSLKSYLSDKWPGDTDKAERLLTTEDRLARLEREVFGK